MKKIYIVLSRSETYPSRMIKMITKGEYTHSSIAIVPCRHQLYSFGRKRLNNFLIGGFLEEDVDKFLYAKFPNMPCAVYEVCVSDKGYSEIADRLEVCKIKCHKYKYNFALPKS